LTRAKQIKLNLYSHLYMFFYNEKEFEKIDVKIWHKHYPNWDIGFDRFYDIKSEIGREILKKMRQK